MRKKIPLKRTYRLAPLGLGACVGTALFAATPAVFAQADPGSARVEKLEKENQDLKKRLDSLEALAKKEGLGAPQSEAVKALSSVELSGFVTTSYFLDTSKPSDHRSNGYLWNTSSDSFSINKVKLTLASKPVERSGDAWDAAYRASLIWGEDATIVNTGNGANGGTGVKGMEDLREAYVELNAPVGSGLNIKAGQLISLLNYESGDGGVANSNFSQGYQWYYTGNGPSAGVQLGYTFTDWLDAKVRVQNGLYAGGPDNNAGKTVLGSIGIKPTKDLWFSLIGFGGNENAAFSVSGGSLLAGYQITEQLGTGFEFDYFRFDPDPAPTAEFWSAGTWLTYDFTPKVGLALRGEYLDDKDGFGIKGISLGGRGGSALSSADPTGDLASLTLTLNYKPVAHIKIQPEVRYDHTAYSNGFDGQTSRFLVGAGVSYQF